MGKGRAEDDEGVPNAPCGVESLLCSLCPLDLVLFLMHRVELKESYSTYWTLGAILVPNAPCGVERSSESWMTMAPSRS